MRIMTNNIWGNYFNNPPQERTDGLIQTYDRYNPDIIGFQEVKDDWYETKLFSHLSEKYRFIGTEFLYKANDRHVPIAIKKELCIIANGFEYLTDTPDVSKSISWAVVETQNQTARFAVCNTHFWWMRGSEHDEIRVTNAKQLVALMKFLHDKYNCPVFAMGDMNTKLDSGVFTVYKECGVVDLYDVAKSKHNRCSLHGNPQRDEKGVFRGNRTEKDHSHSIDHIIALNNKYIVERYEVVEDQEVLDSTDHSPVYVDVFINR